MIYRNPFAAMVERKLYIVQELIEQLDRWLRSNRPNYYSYLLPGLTDDELRAFETTLGVELPTDFKLLYAWKNGQVGQDECLVPNLEWLKAEWVISRSSIAPKVELDGFVTWNHQEMWESGKSQNWVSFLTDSSGNDYVLDLIGVYDNKPGQIVSYWNDAIGCDEIIHPSFYKWLETVVIALERGLFTGDEDDSRLQEYESYDTLIRENNPGYPISTQNL